MNRVKRIAGNHYLRQRLEVGMSKAPVPGLRKGESFTDRRGQFLATANEPVLNAYEMRRRLWYPWRYA